MDVAINCQFTRTHEWVRVEGALAVVGITDHAQEALGDITFVELPSAGQDMTQGGELGVIESVKAASDFHSPLSGQVAEINGALDGKPELINESPYDQGWLVKLRGVKEEQLTSLMDAAGYRRFLESEA